MARAKTAKKTAPATAPKAKVNSAVLDLLGNVEEQSDLLEVLKSDALGKVTTLAEVMAALSEQIEMAESMEDMASIILTMRKIGEVKLYTETRKSVLAIKKCVPKKYFPRGADIDEDGDDEE